VLVVMLVMVLMVLLSVPSVMVLVIFGLRKKTARVQTTGVCCYR
jgi:hypothetical protein